MKIKFHYRSYHYECDIDTNLGHLPEKVGRRREMSRPVARAMRAAAQYFSKIVGEDWQVIFNKLNTESMYELSTNL